MRTSENPTPTTNPPPPHSLIGVTPIKDNVIIATMEIPERIGLIWTAPIARKEVQAGKVVAIGPGYPYPDGTLVPAPVELGDVVVYTGAWQGEEFSRDGVLYRVLENEQIAAINPGGDVSNVDIRHLVP